MERKRAGKSVPRSGETGPQDKPVSNRDEAHRGRKSPASFRSVVALFRHNGIRSHDPDLFSDETLVILVREGLGAAAERKSMSKRTLRRRIREAGTTVSEIVRGARRSLSLRLIPRDDRMSEISSWLGYESSRCFSRFVRREFGETPSELRSRLRKSERLGQIQ